MGSFRCGTERAVWCHAGSVARLAHQHDCSTRGIRTLFLLHKVPWFPLFWRARAWCSIQTAAVRCTFRYSQTSRHLSIRPGQGRSTTCCMDFPHLELIFCISYLEIIIFKIDHFIMIIPPPSFPMCYFRFYSQQYSEIVFLNF